MHQFKDNQGRAWKVALNGWQLKKLKEQLDFDARDHQSIMQAAGDPVLLVNVLYLLCEEQATEANISDKQFGEAMSGDAIDDAAEAYLAESIDFFPRSQRPALTKVLATVKDYQTRATELATEKLQSPAMTTLVAKAIEEAGQKLESLLAGTSTGNSSGKLQESPA
jgi:hypothetical protein